jgi:hypothetical protein
MCVCVFAQVVEGVGGYARLLLNLYQVFVEYSGSQQDDEVCSNSVYGLGVLAANALPDIIRLGGEYSLSFSPPPSLSLPPLPSPTFLHLSLPYIFFFFPLYPTLYFFFNSLSFCLPQQLPCHLTASLCSESDENQQLCQGQCHCSCLENDHGLPGLSAFRPGIPLVLYTPSAALDVLHAGDVIHPALRREWSGTRD